MRHKLTSQMICLFNMKIHSKVHDGLISPEAYSKLRDALTQHEQSLITITVAKQVRRRSNQQSRFYRGVVVPLVMQLFWDSGEPISKQGVHDFLKKEIGGFVKARQAPDGKMIWEMLSSTKLSAKQWEDWLDAIRAWAAPFGLQIPYPNENTDYSTLEDDDYDAVN